MNKDTVDGGLFPTKLDATDRRLLARLQENAKYSVKELAGELGLTKTPVYERIRRLEEEGYIRRYVALVNPRAVGMGVTVYCHVSMEQQRREHFMELRRALADLPEVMEAYAVGGATDFMLKIVVADLDAYYRFTSEKLAVLPYIGKISSTFVLNEIKHSTAVPSEVAVP